jgi:hypothetical protein
MPQGAVSAAAQAAVERWRRHINFFWTPTMSNCLVWRPYNDDPRFRQNYDR